MNIRSCSEADLPLIAALIRGSDNFLRKHTDYTYFLLFRYCNEFCLLAEDHGKAVGFVTSIFGATEPKRIYAWQCGVIPSYRRRGVAKTLMNELLNRARRFGIEFIEFAIEPGNDASLSTVRSVFGEDRVKELPQARINYLDSDDGHCVDEVVYQVDLRGAT